MSYCQRLALVPEKGRGEIRAIGPDNGFALGIDPDLIEQGQLFQWFKHLAPQVGFQINHPPLLIAKTQVEFIRVFARFNRFYSDHGEDFLVEVLFQRREFG